MAIFSVIHTYDKSMSSITIFNESCTYDRGKGILPFFLMKPTLVIEAFVVCHFL